MPLHAQCTICTAEFSSMTVAALPCGHTYHYECVAKWVQQAKSCPHCRKSCTKAKITNLFFDIQVPETIHEGRSEMDIVEITNLRGQITALEKEIALKREDIEVEREKVKRLETLNRQYVHYKEENEHLAGLERDYTNLKKEFKKMVERLKLCEFYKKISKGDFDKDIKSIDAYLKDGSDINVARLLESSINEKKKLQSLLNERNREKTDLLKKNMNLEQQLTESVRLCGMLKDEIVSFKDSGETSFVIVNKEVEKYIDSSSPSRDENRKSMGFVPPPRFSISSIKSINENGQVKKSMEPSRSRFSTVIKPDSKYVPIDEDIFIAESDSNNVSFSLLAQKLDEQIESYKFKAAPKEDKEDVLDILIKERAEKVKKYKSRTGTTRFGMLKSLSFNPSGVPSKKPRFS
uniref:RING-type domain-containing protein n=1 Tax=Parastrongyloides trichosuri TaxID=131310 RepID=A0A0N5A2X8_PARTI